LPRQEIEATLTKASPLADISKNIRNWGSYFPNLVSKSPLEPERCPLELGAMSRSIDNEDNAHIIGFRRIGSFCERAQFSMSSPSGTFWSERDDRHYNPPLINF